MDKPTFLAFPVLIILLSAASGTAQTFRPEEAVESVGPGTVNWTTSEVYAVGLGAPSPAATNPGQVRAMAERAAYAIALRNLLETVKGVRVDAETVVEDFLVKSDVIRTRVEGIVKGARVVKKRYLSDGSVEMLVAMPMTGAFLNAVVPETFGTGAIPPSVVPDRPAEEPRKVEPAQPEPPPAKTPDRKAGPVPPPSPPEKKAAPELPPAAEPTLAFKGGVATGVVIDGRGLGLRPALLPRIVDPDGREVYVGQIVTRTNAVEQGVAGYAKDVNAAANNFRVTDNPAVIKGLRVSGQARTDVVVAQADALALSDLGRKGDFLQNCRVIIVY